MPAERNVFDHKNVAALTSSQKSLPPMWWPRDTDWPPIPEPYRCLESGRSSLDFEDELYDTFVTLNGGERADCPLITDDICEGKQFYPVPCNCHAYVECVQFETDGDQRACIKKCEPYDLIYDPNTQVCVYETQAPPGVCADTPVSPAVPYTTLGPLLPDPTTPEPTTPEPTTPEPTTPEPTTPEPTTPEPTTPEPTTPEPTTPEPTTPEPTTPEPTTPPVDCTYFGQTFPYPGDCHLYYICLPNSSGGYDIEIFDCEEMVYDPNQASCSHPTPEVEEILCNGTPFLAMMYGN